MNIITWQGCSIHEKLLNALVFFVMISLLFSSLFSFRFSFNWLRKSDLTAQSVQTAMDVSAPPIKRRKMAQPSHAAAVLPMTDYRYNEKNVFSLLLQSDGLEIPLIYDSQHTFAALDKYPIARGHALLIVKHPAATLMDNLPPAVAQATMVDLQALVRAVQRATGCAGIRISQSNGPAAGQTVPQLHFHIIPVYDPSSPPSTTAPTVVNAAATAGQREQLSAADAGPLLAHIRNALPESYAPGYHVWAANEAEMEALGWALQESCSLPGTVLALSGHLGAGKSTISRGFVRGFVRDPLLEVPSPTFLLCLSYQDDIAYEGKVAPGEAGGAVAEPSPSPAAAEAPAVASPGRARCVHHMDPYRLGQKSDKMAGLIDFDAAFKQDVCLIEWPDKMPGSVMVMAERGLAVDVSGMGAQASGRLVSITSLGTRFKPPPAKARKAGGGGSGGGGGGGGKAGAAAAGMQQQSESQTQLQEQQQQLPSALAENVTAVTVALPPPSAAADGVVARCFALDGGDGGNAEYEQLLRRWRQQYPASVPRADVAWRGTAAAAAGEDAAADALAGRRCTGASGAASTVNAAAAAALAGGNPAQWVVLGIESSCDDTAAAVVRGDGTVLSHEIASQTGLHEQYGGVKPDVARQAHAAAIEATVNSALQRAGVEAGSLTAVAVTAGPGLALCLQVGVQYGLTLAARHGLPYIPVHHMEAHAMMTRLPSVNETPMQFPSLLLLVSGGHNMLVLCEGVGRHRIIGTTLDDSVGECFDKIARVAGITAVPGGPHLERMAASARLDAHIRYPLTLPLANGAQKDSCNFSFSGLKTQVMTLIMQKRKELGLPDLPPPPALAAAAAAAAAAGGGGGAAGGGETTMDCDAAPPPAATATAAAAMMAGKDGTAGSAREVVMGGDEGEAEGRATATAAAEAEFAAAVADIAASFQRTAVRFLQQRTRRALEWLREDAAQQLGSVAAAAALATTATTRGGGEEAACEVEDADAAAAAAAAAAATGPAGASGAVTTACQLRRERQQQQHQPGFVRSLVVAGGVAANAAVRTGLSEVAAEFGLPCVYPPVRYCTDNGLMVAWTGVERLKLGLYQQPPRGAAAAAAGGGAAAAAAGGAGGGGVDAHVQVIPRWPIGPMDPRSTANKGRAHIKILH